MTRPRKPSADPPPPAHLSLGEGATHPGLLDDCGDCAAYYAAHPETRMPSGYGGAR